ncbi:MAG: glycosyltransferase, partial [Candidatus Paceibacteria bacterium]
ASDYSYIYLEGEMERDKMVDLIQQHKYGIHGREGEHFGIAVAELVAAKCITFVPDAGGQKEIIKNIKVLRYGSKQEAVEKIDKVISEENIQEKIKYNLPTESEMESKYGQERFKEDILTVVEKNLDTKSPKRKDER